MILSKTGHPWTGRVSALLTLVVCALLNFLNFDQPWAVKQVVGFALAIAAGGVVVRTLWDMRRDR